MFGSLFKPRPKKGGKAGEKSPVPPKDREVGGGAQEAPDEEYQLPSLHRREIVMTADLKRRMEEEKLRERYQLAPAKTGAYL